MVQILVEDLEKRFRVAERRPGMSGAIIGLIHRKHREVNALHGVSFAIQPGELVGYIGPNGAGKSTTIKILSGILVPSGGRCEVNGLGNFERTSFWRTPVTKCATQDQCVPYYRWVTDYIAVLGGR